MNSSLTTADRTTHLKIVVVSLIAALVVLAVGISAHATALRFGAARHNGDELLTDRALIQIKTFVGFGATKARS